MERTVKIVLTLLLVASLVIAIVPLAMSADGQRDVRGNRTMAAPIEAYMVISAKNVTATSASFDVVGHALRTADGRAMAMNFTKPMAGQYFFGNDTAIITIDKPPRAKVSWGNNGRPRSLASRTGGPAGEGGRRPVMGDYSAVTLNVSGASAVVAMKNLTRLGDNRTLQFSNMNVYLPGGNLTAYQLGTPVTISMHNRTTTITGSPELRAIFQGIMGSNNRFPANAAPVKLTDIDAK